MQKSGILIIYSSPNGRDSWAPVLPENVPAFVKEPDTLGKLVAGDMCMDAASASPVWYRAEEVKTPHAETELGAVY